MPRILKPTIFAVEAPHACFGAEGNAGGDRFCEDFSEMGKVIRMYRSVCAPVPQLFQRLAAIFKDLTIYGFEVTVRGQDRNEARYPVNRRAQTSLAFAERLLGTLAFGQIEHECEALVTSFLEHRGANKHRDAAAVFPKILLLEGLNDPVELQFSLDEYVALAPFGRGQLGPAHVARNQVFTVISYDT